MATIGAVTLALDSPERRHLSADDRTYQRRQLQAFRTLRPNSALGKARGMSARGRIHRSVSTWQQPFPGFVSAEREALVDRIAERVLALGSHRLAVGIDGLTASGKTSFGHELAERIARTGRPVLRTSLDDFKNTWRDRHRYDRATGEGP
ncbi:hypothetical protein [Nocardia thraciensis]